MREWYINWGDGTTQTFGSIGGAANPSDSHTDGTGSDHSSTDTIAFTHTFPAWDIGVGYPLTIYAITDENAYSFASYNLVVAPTLPDTDNISLLSFNTIGDPSAFPIDGIADTSLQIAGPTAGTFSIDWGDGTSSTVASDSGGSATAPPHDYQNSWMHNVAVTEAADDTADYPDGTLIGHYSVWTDVPAAQITPPPAIVAIAGQNVSTQIPINVGDSTDPLFATVDWGDGTGTHTVPVSGNQIDLSNLIAPVPVTAAEQVYGFNVTIDLYNGNCINGVGYPVPTRQPVGIATIPIYVWTISIGPSTGSGQDDGSADEPLVSSPDGTQDRLPVTVNYPHPAGIAYDMTLSVNDNSDSSQTGVELWSADGSTQLIGDWASSYHYESDPNKYGDRFEISGIDDNADQTPDLSEYLTLTATVAADSPVQPTDGEQATPAGPVVSNKVDGLAAALSVATINDGVASGTLSVADMQGAGAFVPLDNNDWDYDLTTDVNQSGASPIAGAFRVFKNADRTGLIAFGASGVLPSGVVANKFAANVETHLYIEGTGDTTSGSPAMLYLNFVDVKRGVTDSHAASCKITVFAIAGALDVPGNGTYPYGSDVTGGSWMTPNGGKFTGPIVDPNSVAITWNDGPVFGEANYKASSNYVWSCQVNVVQVKLQWNTITNGKPMQKPDKRLISSDRVDSNGNPNSLGAIYASGGPIVQGPAGPDGKERGVHFIKFGWIQNVKTMYEQATFINGAVRKSVAAGPTWWVDINDGDGPWYSEETPYYVDKAMQDPVGEPFKPQLGVFFSDVPYSAGTDTWGFFTHAISFKILDEFELYFAAETTAYGYRAFLNYVLEEEAKWDFNGSGSIDVNHVWSPIAETGDHVPPGFGAVVDKNMVISGPSANEHFEQYPGYRFATPSL